MGYGGKWQEREQARELRAQAWTLREIADELGVAKGTVSVWVRDVEFTPKPRNRGTANQRPHPLHVAKLAELERCRQDAEEWVGSMTDRELTAFCLGLYAGEGNKTKSIVGLANTNPALLLVFVRWLRQTFDIDESRLRVVVYLHAGLDIEAAIAYWSSLLGVPADQFSKPYRAAADRTRRSRKHEHGCATVRYSCSRTFRRLLAMIEAVTYRVANPG